jgi:hypothetical protein
MLFISVKSFAGIHRLKKLEIKYQDLVATSKINYVSGPTESAFEILPGIEYYSLIAEKSQDWQNTEEEDWLSS